MTEKDYKKDEDGHYIIAENVHIIFSSVMEPTSEIVEEKTDDEEPTDDETD